MTIKNLFKKEIDRRINAAVVVSEMDKESVQQEIEEYIFTNDIVTKLYDFLSAITENKKDKTGVWINGYYGSGKSHFIKYLFYCLNKTHRDKAIERYLEAVKKINETNNFSEVTLSNASKITKDLDKFKIDEIIFNIDVVSGKKNKNAITNVLMNQFNKFRGYNDSNITLALLIEKHLDKKGLFQDFQDKIESDLQEKWKGNEHRYVERSLSKVVEIAQSFDDSIDPESLKQAILSPRDYRIEDLIREFQAYLQDKDENYRLIFLLDEMSQYIGSNTSLLLNLQSIVEEVSTYCNNKIWIACTAQQDLNNLIENRDNKTEDFGKILGRFDTRISLQSQDASYITKKRVLDKSIDGEDELKEFYKKNEIAIKNQFVVVHDLYKNYTDRNDFLLTYPFIPYQFQLITDVFTAFSNALYVTEGVRDTERSILGITHFTAQQCMNEEVGYFVPFDLFFNDQLRNNLTHRANNIISKAYNIQEIKQSQFGKRVVNVLFMLSSLLDSQQVNFPATVENIAHLLMDNLNDTKLNLQQKTKKYLSVLVDKKIIQESDNIYRFYKEDEIEVANLIESTSINNSHRNAGLKKIIEKSLDPFKTQHYKFGNNNFIPAANIDDYMIKGKGDFKIQFLFFDQNPAEDIALNVSRQDLIICCNEWFTKDATIRKQLEKYVKTDEFISNNLNNAQGNRRETIEGFRKEADKILENLVKIFNLNFLKTRFVSAQAVIEPSSVTALSPKDKLNSVIDKHLEEVFNKQMIAYNYVTEQGDLRIKANDPQLTIDKVLTAAEEEIENYLTLQGDSAVLNEVVNHFKKIPYGWKDISTLHILIELSKKDKRRFEFNHDSMPIKAFGINAVNARNREKITILPQKGYSIQEVQQFIFNVNEILNNTVIPSNTQSFKIAIDAFKNSLKEYLTEAEKLKRNNGQKPYSTHFFNFHQMLASIYEERDNEKVYEIIRDNKQAYTQLRDLYVQAKEFVEDRGQLMKSFESFVHKHFNNFKSLNDVEQIKSDRLQVFLNAASEPWNDFPEMKKIYRGLEKALESKVKELQQEAAEKYQKAIDIIEEKQASLKLDNVLPNLSNVIQEIENLTTISELKLKIEKVRDFETRNIKRLYDTASKRQQQTKKPKPAPPSATDTTDSNASVIDEPTYEPPTATIYELADDEDLGREIKDEDDLNDYINTLRAKIQQMLKENKIVIIK